MAGLVELATPSIDALPGEESVVGDLVYNTGVNAEAYDLEVVRGLVEEGVTTIPGIGGDIAKEGVEELAYAATPVQALMSFIEGCRALSGQLDRITCPVLLFTSPQDHVVDPVSSDALAAGVRGPVERVTLERSFHVATLDHDAKLIEDRASAFINEVAKAG